MTITITLKDICKVTVIAATILFMGWIKIGPVKSGASAVSVPVEEVVGRYWVA